jgi:hypothetical protein
LRSEILNYGVPTQSSMNTGNLKPIASAKKFSAKKPKDKPKRPLSSYNFFLKVCSPFVLALHRWNSFHNFELLCNFYLFLFQAEREKIVRFVKGEGTDDHEPDQPAADASVLKLKGDRICFEQMGKLIGRRWKTLSAESLKRYSDMALADAERYKNEMAEYKARRDERIKAEIAVARQNQVSNAAAPTLYGGTTGSSVEQTYAPPYFDSYGFDSYGYPPPSHPSLPHPGAQSVYPPVDYSRSDPYMPQTAYGEYSRHQQYHQNYYSRHSRGGYGAPPPLPPYSSSQYYPSQHAPEHISGPSSVQTGYSLPPAHHPHHITSVAEPSSAQPFHPSQVPSAHRLAKDEDYMYYQPPQGRFQMTEQGSPKRPRTHPRPF